MKNKTELVELLKAMQDNEFEVAKSFKATDPAYSKCLQHEAYAYQTVIWLLTDSKFYKQEKEAIANGRNRA